MKNWTIKKQIMLGLSILILITLSQAYLPCLGISKLKSFMENISTTQLRGVYSIGQIKSGEEEAYNLMLHHILAETADETGAYDNRLTDCEDKNDKLIAGFEQNATFDNQERAMFENVLSSRERFKSAWAPVRDLSLEMKNKEAFDLFKRQSEPAFDKLKTNLEAEIDYNKQIADATAQESIDLTNNTSVLVNLSIIVMLSACIAIAYVIVRSLNRVLTSVADTLGEGANQIVAASGQLASASQTLAENANEQASSLQETSSAFGTNRQHD